MGSGFAKKKKQARMLQQQMMHMQQELQSLEVEGTAGNGLVTITLTGEHEVKQVKIKPECVDPDDIEGLEDLIKAAFDDAGAKLKEKSASGMEAGGMGGLLGGLGF